MANSWGLYDMAGNVEELCHDFYQADLGKTAVTNPVGAGGPYRVRRGGEYGDMVRELRAARRIIVHPNYKTSSIGFRCARTLSTLTTCGNSKIDAGEKCDGSLLGGQTCKTQGYSSGTLKCTSSCTLDFSSCKSTVPGSWITINAGNFSMGSPANDTCRQTDEDQHQVTLSNKFKIQSTEVTQDQFKAVMAYNPSSFTSCGGTCPVEQVTWHEAVAYCNALSPKEGLTACYACTGSGSSVTCSETTASTGKGLYSCNGYRLPTEAEWEYAYRAGTKTDLYNGALTNCTSADTNADKIGWYSSNSSSKSQASSKKTANAWGIYDMAGNVWEWCHDGYQAKLGTSAAVDPVTSGNERILRGGSFQNPANRMRAAERNKWTPTNLNKTVGFRCVKTVP